MPATIARIILRNPHPGQIQVRAEARRFNVLAAGRRWGKNTLGEELITVPAVRGQPVGWFSPTYKNLGDDWRRVCELLAPVVVKKSEQDNRLDLAGGGKVEFWSLERPDLARGRAYARMIVDEAAQVPDLVAIWEKVLRPMTTDFRGDAWLVSTPAGQNDFWKLWQKGQAGDEGWASWQRPTSENPHLPSGEVAAARLDLPEVVFRQEYLAEFLVFVGQFFTEFSSSTHVRTPFDIPKTWRRFGMLDYGYAAPFCYLQAALAPSGVAYMYRELYQSRALDTAQAAMIADACAGDVPGYIVAGPDLWSKSGKGPRGQSSAETYLQVWRDKGFATTLRVADDDRLRGWRRMREWLRPFPAADGYGETARLQIVGCPHLVRTLPTLVHDEHRVEDVDTDGEDHAADACRYGLMSRPQPAVVKPEMAERTGAWLMQQTLQAHKDRRYIRGPS